MAASDNFLIAVFSVLTTSSLLAKTANAKEIDASVDVAIQRFYKQVKGAEKYVKASKGILVMPNIVKGAFVIGGEYGEGALRIGGKSVDYNNTVSGPSVYRSEDKKKTLSFYL
jgi:lipid-binding SYLF domain-containing protein